MCGLSGHDGLCSVRGKGWHTRPCVSRHRVWRRPGAGRHHHDWTSVRAALQELPRTASGPTECTEPVCPQLFLSHLNTDTRSCRLSLLHCFTPTLKLTSCASSFHHMPLVSLRTAITDLESDRTYYADRLLFLLHAVMCEVLFLVLSLTFLFVCEISPELRNGFVPNSLGRRVWSLAWTSLKVKVNFGSLHAVYVWKNVFALVIFYSVINFLSWLYEIDYAFKCMLYCFCVMSHRIALSFHPVFFSRVTTGLAISPGLPKESLADNSDQMPFLLPDQQCAALKGTQSLVCSWSIEQLTAKRWDAVAGCPKPILIFSRRCVTFAWCCHTHTHDHFTALFPGPPGWAGARSELLDFIVQGKINRGRQTDHPTGCHSIRTNQCPPPPSPYFLQAGCPSCRPTNSVKALKATWCRHSQTILPMLDSQVMSPQEIARTG